jgi:hypothetical protein
MPTPRSRHQSRPGRGARGGGRAKTVAAKCERRQRGTQGTGGRGTVHGIAARGGRCPRCILASLHRVRRKELAPWSSHGPRRYRSTTGAQSVWYSKRPKRHGEESPLQGSQLSCATHAGPLARTGLKQFQCGARNALLQSRKLPISVPRAENARICRGLDVASLYLWFRAGEYRNDGRARRCHSTANEKRRWPPRRACPPQH